MILGHARSSVADLAASNIVTLIRDHDDVSGSGRRNWPDRVSMTPSATTASLLVIT
ncbi:hypothetical protein QMZ05_13420 [Bradyrhizobium sp. INPA03-11B]|uniref:hypothetical protein n=1 Tax=Bradyrhizobium sp. INPA03-11B TaxID=418598 RepID=UPI00338E8ED3